MLFSFTSVLIHVIIQLWISIYKFISTFIYTNQGNKTAAYGNKLFSLLLLWTKMLFVASLLKNMVVKIKVS